MAQLADLVARFLGEVVVDKTGIDGVYAQSIAPIVAAGLSHVVAEDADLGDGITALVARRGDDDELGGMPLGD